MRGDVVQQGGRTRRTSEWQGFGTSGKTLVRGTDAGVLIVLFSPLVTTETRVLDTELRPHLPLHGARGLAARTGRILTGPSSLGSAPQSVPVP